MRLAGVFFYLKFLAHQTHKKKEDMTMTTKTWHFVDRYTGEEFFVEATWSQAARAIAEEYWHPTRDWNFYEYIGND